MFIIKKSSQNIAGHIQHSWSTVDSKGPIENSYKYICATLNKHWLSGLCMHRGFEVWLLNGCGLNLFFPKASRQSTRFSQRKSSDITPYFRGGISHRFALGDMNCNNHTERGKQVYIYIHHA